MKKAYMKPEIFFESFNTSTAIAGDCEKPVNLPTQFVCAIPDENGLKGFGIFSMSAAGSQCGVDGTGNERYDGLCYHIPEEAYNLFNS